MRFWALLGALIFVTSGSLTAGPAEARVGIYHWGGSYTRSVAGGVDAISAMGARVARITISPRYQIDYHLSSSCDSNARLLDMMTSPEVKAALDNPQIEAFIVTAFDHVGYGDCSTPAYLNPATYTPENTAAMIQEYSDLTLYLSETYQGTFKRFILSNWESDNAVYCGAAAQFAADGAFRGQCLASYPAVFGSSGPDDSLEGLRLWFQTRARGVQDGRLRAMAKGIRTTRVFTAPEFNIVHALRDHGFKSVLYNVIPSVPFDYISYSSYESINVASDPGASLAADLNLIEAVAKTPAIIIGEAGFNGTLSDSVRKTNEVIQAALAWGVSYYVQWNLYNDSATQDYGLFDVNGNLTPLGNWFESQFSGGSSPPGAWQPQRLIPGLR